jgi:hypothetical protein
MERTVQFRWFRGKVQFEEAVLAEHRRLKSSLRRYVLDSTFLTILTAPVIYFGVVPFFLLDLFLGVYQAICFPVYGIPMAKRADYLIFDRGGLRYLNLVELINYRYCSYGNGVLAWGRETRNCGSNRAALVPDQARAPPPGTPFTLRAFPRVWECRSIPRKNQRCSQRLCGSAKFDPTRPFRERNAAREGSLNYNRILD